MIKSDVTTVAWPGDVFTVGVLHDSGADYVFHTASPFFIDVADPQKELVDPALNGTCNVMKSVAKNK